MSTPVAHGRTESPGGGETQTATPRILAAEPEQRRMTEPGKAERGEEQRKAEEARTTVQAERSDGGTLEDGDWVRTDPPECLGPRGEADEPADDDWEDWIAEQQRQADAALASAVRALALQQTTSNGPIHDVSGKTASRESRASSTREPEEASLEDERREWNEWAAEEQRKDMARDGITPETGDGTGGGASTAEELLVEEEHRKARIAMNDAMLYLNRIRGRGVVPTAGNGTKERQQAPTKADETRNELALHEPPLEYDHTAGAQDMDVDAPPVRRTARRTTNTSWEVGSNIAPQHRYLVQEAYDATRRYGPGEEVAIITEQPHLQYRIAVVRHGTSLIDDEDLSGSRLELQQGIGQSSTWVPHGAIRQLYTQCSRRPGEVIGPGDMIHIRSHRPRTSMYWERSLVAVPFIWATGQQGFRYAKICVKDAAIEASSKGLYQLDGGAHNPKMLRARGSFYAIDRHSPPRTRIPEEDIWEVPGRKGARIQEEWTLLAQDQGTGPWSKPVTTDL